MPPKGQAGPSKKTEAKAKQKIIEDKTFGLKNKNKSAKVNKYIQQVENQVKQGGRRKDPEAEAKTALRDRKKLEEQKKAELAALFKPVVQPQKVPPGVDPKTVICQYFKSGQCNKGDKCKFSHDLNVERKVTKINVYEDRRDEAGLNADGETTVRTEDTMRDWDQNKLEQVVQRKHNKGVKTCTDIVCKYFLEAIEKKTYGWFWECPNGGDQCKYRHALPPGFVLKSMNKDKSAGEEDGQAQLSLEEFLEIERYRIEKRTPVTAETFLKWKADRKARAEAEERAREKEKEAQIRAGKMLHVSGRDLFMYNPELYMGEDGEEEALEVDYTRREEEEKDGDYGNADNDEESGQLQGLDDEDAFLEEDLENLEIDGQGEEEEEEEEAEN